MCRALVQNIALSILYAPPEGWERRRPCHFFFFSAGRSRRRRSVACARLSCVCGSVGVWASGLSVTVEV